MTREAERRDQHEDDQDQFDGARLTSSTTWSDYQGLFFVDLAGTFAQAFPFALDAGATDETFVQEARLVSDAGGKVDWSVGGFYFRKRRTTPNIVPRSASTVRLAACDCARACFTS